MEKHFKFFLIDFQIVTLVVFYPAELLVKGVA